MKIPLDEFEQLIDESILKRGLAYYNNGAITDISEISIDNYEAIVASSEEYTVQLEIKNNVVIEHTCDCPFDMGTVCKHVVAVIYYLQQDKLELNQSTIISPTAKTKSVDQQVMELLKTISHKELIAFITENCKKDKKFRNYFLATFGYLSQNQSKEYYQKQIHFILQSATGREGWIGRSDMKYVVNTTQPFLDYAKQYLQKQNFENVFFISSALLEEMTKAFQYSDDSNGDLGYFVESAMNLLTQVAKEKTSETLKKEIFEYCISAFKQRLFEGWDWHLGVLHIAGDLVVNEHEVTILLDCLKDVKGDYERECAQLYTLELLNKHKDPKEVEQFISKHISNSNIRKREIENAFENKNFDRAIAFCNRPLFRLSRNMLPVRSLFHNT